MKELEHHANLGRKTKGRAWSFHRLHRVDGLARIESALNQTGVNGELNENHRDIHVTHGRLVPMVFEKYPAKRHCARKKASYDKAPPFGHRPNGITPL